MRKKIELSYAGVAFVLLVALAIVLQPPAQKLFASAITGFTTTSGAPPSPQSPYFSLAALVVAVGMAYAYRDKLPEVEIRRD